MNEGTKLAKVNGEPQELDRRLDDHAPTRPYPYGYGTNTGFDGAAYQPIWPDGNTALHPTSIKFSSPLTGSGYNFNYQRFAFEADLPRIEFDTNPPCLSFTVR